MFCLLFVEKNNLCYYKKDEIESMRQKDIKKQREKENDYGTY